MARNLGARAQEIGQDLRFISQAPRLMPLLYDLALREPRRAHGRVLWAESLSQARGRYGRSWVAEKGGLWLAISLYDDHLPQTRGLFPLVFGLALGKLAEDLGVPARIRWINDLHFRGRKLAGVLVEKQGEWLLVGVGINVNNPPPPGLPAESLSRLLGKSLSLHAVLKKFLENLRYYYGALRELEADLGPYDPVPENLLVEEFLRLTDTLGRCVAWAFNLDQEAAPLIGMAREILPGGSLLLEAATGEHILSGGEILYL